MLLWKHTRHKQELDFCSCHTINRWGSALMSDQLYLVHVLQCLVFHLWTAVIVINQALCSLPTGCLLMNLHPIFIFSQSHQICSRSCLHQILSTAHFCNIQFGIPDSAPVPQTRSSVHQRTTCSWNKSEMKTWEVSTKKNQWFLSDTILPGYRQTIFSKSFLYVCVCMCVYV